MGIHYMGRLGFVTHHFRYLLPDVLAAQDLVLGSVVR